jgi:hypothetical protein
MANSPDVPRDQNLFDTIKAFRKPPSLTDNGWVTVDSATDEIAPPFQNSWDGVAGKAPVSFFVDSNGIVYFRGILTIPGGVTYPSVVFTLPVGYRPEYDEPFVISVKGGGYANALVKAVSGNVVIESVVVV